MEGEMMHDDPNAQQQDHDYNEGTANPMSPAKDKNMKIMLGVGGVAAVGLLAAMVMGGGQGGNKNVLEDRQKMTRLAMGLVAVTAGVMTLTSFNSQPTGLMSSTNVIIGGGVLTVLAAVVYLNKFADVFITGRHRYVTGTGLTHQEEQDLFDRTGMTGNLADIVTIIDDATKIEITDTLGHKSYLEVPTKLLKTPLFDKAKFSRTLKKLPRDAQLILEKNFNNGKIDINKLMKNVNKNILEIKNLTKKRSLSGLELLSLTIAHSIREEEK